MKSKEFFKILALKNMSINVYKVCTVGLLYIGTFLRTLQAGIWNNSHLIKNLFRLPRKQCGILLYFRTYSSLKKAKNKQKTAVDLIGSMIASCFGVTQVSIL